MKIVKLAPGVEILLHEKYDQSDSHNLEAVGENLHIYFFNFPHNQTFLTKFVSFSHAKPWILGGRKSIFMVVIN